MIAALLALWLGVVPAYEWRSLGPDGGGTVTCLALSPTDPGLLLAGSEAGGVLRSIDGGRHWSVAGRGLRHDSDAAIADLAFHPTAPGVVYAATGRCEGRPTGDWGGLLISQDGGRSWALQSVAVRFAGRGTVTQRGCLLVTDPARPDELWAATAWDGVFHSADRGRQWTPLGLSGAALVALHRAANGTLYAAAAAQAGQAGGVFRKAPGPGGWARIYDGAVAGLAAAPGRLLLAAPDAGLLLSEDDGRHWTNVTPAGFAERLVSAVVRFAPGHPLIGLAAGVERPQRRRWPSVWLTLDGGQTWQPITAPGLANVTASGGWAGREWYGYRPTCALFDPADPRRLWLGDGTGLWATHDGAASWFAGTSGLPLGTVRQLVADPAEPEVAWLGLAGSGIFRLEARAGVALPAGGNGSPLGSVPGLCARLEDGRTAVYLSRGETLWRQTERFRWTAVAGRAPGPLGRLRLWPGNALLAEAAGYPLQFSDDGGIHWRPWGRLPSGAEAAGPATGANRPAKGAGGAATGAYGPAAGTGGASMGTVGAVALGLPEPLDTRGRAAVAVGADGEVYRTDDAGAHWRVASGDLPPSDFQGRRGRHVERLAVGPGSPPVLYAGTPFALWRSLDGGRHWARVVPAAVQAVAVDPTTGRLYVATGGGWADPAPARLLASDDTGESFTDLGASLPAVPLITAILPAPTPPGRVWLGTAGNGAWVGEPVGGGEAKIVG